MRESSDVIQYFHQSDTVKVKYELHQLCQLNKTSAPELSVTLHFRGYTGKCTFTSPAGLR